MSYRHNSPLPHRPVVVRRLIAITIASAVSSYLRALYPHWLAAARRDLLTVLRGLRRSISQQASQWMRWHHLPWL
jgi:hypothetical protein